MFKETGYLKVEKENVEFFKVEDQLVFLKSSFFFFFCKLIDKNLKWDFYYLFVLFIFFLFSFNFIIENKTHYEIGSRLEKHFNVHKIVHKIVHEMFLYKMYTLCCILYVLLEH